VQEDRREEDVSRVVEEGDRLVEVFVRAVGLVEVEDEGADAQASEVQHEGRALALPEEHEEADEQVDDAD
jgi:hypothetical protein